jgi:uncharacterized membrane protein YeaQ/YmgE (transglycosylase-associated protein family)
MDILISLVIGGVIGWLASIVMKTNAQMGIIANIIVGIVGSWLGSWLAPMIGLAPIDGIGRFLVGVGGAVVLILILRALKIFKGASAARRASDGERRLGRRGRGGRPLRQAG